MESIADENDNLITAINEILDAMRERDEIEDRSPGQTYHFISIVEEADAAIEAGAPDNAYNKLSRLLASFDDKTLLSAEGNLLFTKVKKLHSNLAEELGIDKDPFPTIEPTAESDYHNIPLINKIFDQRISEFQYQIKLTQDALNQSLADAERRNYGIVSIYNSKADTLDKLIKDTEDKHESINELLESAAGRVIASDYQQSALNEKNTADYLRYASLGFMVVAAGVLIYTVYESSSAGFNMESSIFRLLTAILLSVPAAYLARESAKHREQQHSHHQTSLDLITITPYLATLPDDMQHEIKADIAKRIFASRQAASSATDSYPLSLQEAMIEAMKKLEPRKTKSNTEIPS